MSVSPDKFNNIEKSLAYFAKKGFTVLKDEIDGKRVFNRKVILRVENTIVFLDEDYFSDDIPNEFNQIFTCITEMEDVLKNPAPEHTEAQARVS